MVTKMPPSTDVMVPICFVPFLAIILVDFLNSYYSYLVNAVDILTLEFESAVDSLSLSPRIPPNSEPERLPYLSWTLAKLVKTVTTLFLWKLVNSLSCHLISAERKRLLTL
ncbi:hypothetical protein AVEN_147862-1 [Araneus ventricosus]|uniref:Uncharacterized protein n=1 Tax=Araneus ventricosus TaxID=182803 RepID=A0A4Y2V0E8_ARAVE|nr:hypothetical protein AVEN_257012-1 [Araneus ventricosus]GBO18686.1 hypothetical protein AVEN_147862-1 [Araneus ventricosus]